MGIIVVGMFLILLTSAKNVPETNVAERHGSSFHWHKRYLRFHVKNNINIRRKRTHWFTSHKVVSAQLQIGPQQHCLARYISHQPQNAFFPNDFKHHPPKYRRWLQNLAPIEHLESHSECPSGSYRNPQSSQLIRRILPSPISSPAVPTGLELEGKGRQPALRRSSSSTSRKLEGSEAQVWNLDLTEFWDCELRKTDWSSRVVPQFGIAKLVHNLSNEYGEYWWYIRLVIGIIVHV